MKICVAIATAGRRDLLSQTVAFLRDQTRAPDSVIIAPARPEDADLQALTRSYPELVVVSGPVGSSAQRNSMLVVSDADVIVFFDDDFLAAPDYLAELERLFAADPTIAIATGHVEADGVTGPGLDFSEGASIVASIKAVMPGNPVVDTFNGYGCNMAVRMSLVRQHAIRFDENLPLYSWLEDVDFSRQLAPHGRIVKALLLQGVHLGHKKSGRSPGKRLGYSQIANRIYIWRKGNMSMAQAVDGNIRNVFSNVLHSLSPEPWVDRRGRLAGNIIAIGDYLTGKLNPRKILEFE